MYIVVVVDVTMDFPSTFPFLPVRVGRPGFVGEAHSGRRAGVPCFAILFALFLPTTNTLFV